MSLNQAQIVLPDVREFTVQAAVFIAMEVSRGASVKDLHECHEDMVPNPLIVNRWRRSVPAFDMLMEEAEIAKAQGLADEVIGIASDQERPAAISKNMMVAHQWLSGKLSDQFAADKSVTINADVRLTDDQLIAIASGGRVIEGQSVPVLSEPVAAVVPEPVVVEEPVEEGWP